jgi:hypothetical protein
MVQPFYPLSKLSLSADRQHPDNVVVEALKRALLQAFASVDAPVGERRIKTENLKQAVRLICTDPRLYGVDVGDSDEPGSRQRNTEALSLALNTTFKYAGLDLDSWLGRKLNDYHLEGACRVAVYQQPHNGLNIRLLPLA